MREQSRKELNKRVESKIERREYLLELELEFEFEQYIGLAS